MKVIVKKVDRVFDGFFKLDRAVMQYEKFDGTISREMERLCVQRGNAAAILLVNPVKGTIILTEQFRYPAYVSDPARGWLLEVVAGIIQPDENAKQSATREIWEEVGFRVEIMEEIESFYSSPGSSTEFVYLLYSEVRDDQRISSGGGLEEECEDVRMVEITFEDTFERLDEGRIHDAKTLIALHWFRNNPRYAEIKIQLENNGDRIES